MHTAQGPAVQLNTLNKGNHYMAQIYTILAYSPSRNTTQRELDEDSLQGRHTMDQRTATMKAESFATRMNQRSPEPKDWRAKTELITTMG